MNYISKKLFMGLIYKIKLTYKEGRLLSVIFQKTRPYFRGLILIFFPNKYLRKIKIYDPIKIKSKVSKEDKLIHRLFLSYSRMINDQEKKYGEFKPSSAWQKFLDTEYSILRKSVETNSIEDFNFFLQNFGSWDKYQGIENTTLIKNNNNFFRKRFLKNDVFYKSLKQWKWITNNRYPISDLSYPRFGNQVGAMIEGNFVGTGSFFNDYYGRIFENIVSDKKRPIIGDLGGGYGKLGYFTLRNLKEFSFIDFDIPEILTLASFYLLSSFPEKNFLLYGEEKFDKNSFKKFDLIFMPPWEIKSLEDNSIDLFINKNSLGEMSMDSVDSYIKHITRSTKYFFHLNHEFHRNYFSNGETSYINQEYKIPDDMKLVIRYPDLGHLLYMGSLDYNMDIFFYLFEKK